MLRTLSILIFCLFYLVNCSSSNNNAKNVTKEVRTPEEIYIQARNLFDKEQYELANEQFKKLKKLYPLSNEAIQSEIMIGFISYLRLDYESAIFQFDRIINKFPSHKDLDYVYYMKALCNYEQITNHALDGTFNEISIDNFQQVINRFPDSKYAKDSRQKIILINSNKAAKHMEIGRFYLNEKKYTAALNRFKIVIEEYSVTKFTPEALHRMVEVYYEMGMIEESLKTASVLGHNYPDSEWYTYSYNLLMKTDNKNSIFNKIRNFFDG